MYVCMYVCMYVFMYVCMYVCMHVCMHVCIYVCMYICLFIFMFILIFLRFLSFDHVSAAVTTDAASHRQRPPRAFDKPGAVRHCPGRGRWERAQEPQNWSSRAHPCTQANVAVCFQTGRSGKVGRLSQLTAPCMTSVCVAV